MSPKCFTERMKAEQIDLAALKAEGVVPGRTLVAKVILSGKLTRKLVLKGVDGVVFVARQRIPGRTGPG